MVSIAINREEFEADREASSVELPIAVTYIPLVIISLAVTFNTISFILFVVDKEMKKLSSMRYLALISIFDTFSLFTWNLNQYLKPNFGFEIEFLNKATCRVFIFMQFTTLQIGSLLRCLICVDRYFTILNVNNSKKWISKVPFGTPRTAKYWSLLIIITIFLLNSHLLIFAGYDEYFQVLFNRTTSEHQMMVNATIREFNCYKTKFYAIRPMWNQSNFVLNCSMPFLIMSIFDALLIYKTFIIKSRTRTNHNFIVDRSRRRLTRSLVIITFIYLIMSFPSSIFFSFFIFYLNTYYGPLYSLVLNSVYFSQHSILFFECYFTNTKFRKCCHRYFQRYFSIVKYHRRQVRSNYIQRHDEQNNHELVVYVIDNKGAR